MRRLNSFIRMKFVVAITVFSMATLAFVGGASAKQGFQLQKRYTRGPGSIGLHQG
jgi:hypothetical protein